ncbi:MAG: hypothetical protein ACLRPR_03725 [Eisenbergiella sp.]
MKKKIWAALMCTALLLNVAAWKSSRFCDFMWKRYFRHGAASLHG